MVKVLFVCLGNICRSPTAQGVFERLLEEHGLSDHIDVDSAGTSGWHIGDPPDRRMQKAAQRRGIDLSGQRSRRVMPDDCNKFDYILAMDRANLDDLVWMCPDGTGKRVGLFMDYAGHLGVPEVPDPYYGGRRGFEQVLDLIEEAAEGLLEHIKRNDLDR